MCLLLQKHSRYYVCSINTVGIDLFNSTEFSSHSSDGGKERCLRLHSMLKSDPDPETSHFRPVIKVGTEEKHLSPKGNICSFFGECKQGAATPLS